MALTLETPQPPLTKLKFVARSFSGRAQIVSQSGPAVVVSTATVVVSATASVVVSGASVVVVTAELESIPVVRDTI